MFRLLLLFSGAFGISFLFLRLTNGAVAPLFNSLGVVMLPVSALFGALSFAFFNYIEGVIKDIPKKLRSGKPVAYALVVKTLTDLKAEVVINVLLVASMLVLTYVIVGVLEVFSTQQVVLNEYWIWAGLGARSACFITSLAVVVVQLMGFITANNLRAEISMGAE